MSVLERVDRALARVENVIAASALGGATVITIAGVFMRYVLNSPLAWGEEAAILLLIYSAFIGAVIALRHDEHVGMDVLEAAVRERGKRILALTGALMVTLYCLAFGAIAWAMLFTPLARSGTTESTNIPFWIPLLAVPLGLTLMLIRSLQVIYRAARGRDPYPEAAGDSIEEVQREGAGE